jgi:hypothetical protein
VFIKEVMTKLMEPFQKSFLGSSRNCPNEISKSS